MSAASRIGEGATRGALRLIFALGLLTTTPSLCAQAVNPVGPLQAAADVDAAFVSGLRIHDKALVSGVLRDANLGRTLTAIAANAGFGLEMPSTLGEVRVSEQFESTVLEEALRRLLHGYSYAIRYAKPLAGDGGQRRLRSLHVIAAKGTAPRRALPEQLEGINRLAISKMRALDLQALPLDVRESLVEALRARDGSAPFAFEDAARPALARSRLAERAPGARLADDDVEQARMRDAVEQVERFVREQLQSPVNLNDGASPAGQ